MADVESEGETREMERGPGSFLFQTSGFSCFKLV